MKKGVYGPRLERLKGWLAVNHYNGFLVPQGDEFLNKMTAPYAERLRWLSGFEGTAGVLVVTPQQAVFFTDRRYSVRARLDLDPDLFEVFDTAECSLEKWLKEHIPAGQALAYDPWLYNFQQIDFYEKNLKPFGIELAPVTPNPVDTFWEDQPQRPHGEIWEHPMIYAGESPEDKRRKIAASLEPEGCLFIASGESICWLFNIRGQDIELTPIPQAYALLEASGKAHLFIELQKVTPAVWHALGAEVTFWDLNEIVSAIQLLVVGKKVSLDPKETPYALRQLIEEVGGTWVAQANPCTLPKALKNDVERAQIRHGHVLEGVALTRFLCWLDTEAPLDESLGEWDASQKLYDFKKEGAHYWSESFEAIAGCGPNGAMIHYRPSAKSQTPLTQNALLLLDTGAHYKNGTTTDMTRTLILGTPLPEHREIYTRVLKGHIALARARFPEGTRGIHLEALARLSLWEKGLDYPHSTGHGVGSFLKVHEGPQGFTSRDDGVTLVPSMIITIEPGYYKEGHFGVRLENLVEIVEREQGENGKRFFGFEPLTVVPFEERLLVIALLTPAEIEWLDAYHQQVYTTLSPLVNEKVRTWLLSKTRPLRDSACL